MSRKKMNSEDNVNTSAEMDSVAAAESIIKGIKGRNSSGKKRSFYKQDDHIDDLEVFDAAKEIQDRREEEKLKEQKKKEDSRNAFGILNNMSVEEMENHYSHCIKLCSDNKVNAKNAFKLQLIDYMKLILTKKTKQTENLPLMSCTLDASAKIYSYRVDKVYLDMVNIVSKKELKGESGETEGKGKHKRNKSPEKLSMHEDISDEGEREELTRKEMDARYEKFLGSHESFARGKIEQEYYGQTLPKDMDYFMDLPLVGPECRIAPIYDKLFIDTEKYPSSDNSYDIGPCFLGDTISKNLGKLIPGYKDMWKNFSILEDSPVPKEVDPSFVYHPDVFSLENSEGLRLCDAESAKNSLQGFNQDMEEGDCENGGGDGGLEYEDLFEVDRNEEEIQEVAKISESNENKRTRFSIAATVNLVSSSTSDYSFFDETKFALWKKPDPWQLRHQRASSSNIKKGQKSKKTKQLTFQNGEIQNQNEKLLCRDGKILTDKTLRQWCDKKHWVSLDIPNAKAKITCCFKNEFMSIIRKGGSKSKSESSVDFDNSFKFTPEDFLDDDERLGDENGNNDGYVQNEGEMGDDWDDDDVDENPSDDEKNGVDNSMASTSCLNVPESDTRMSLIPVPYKVNQIPIQYAKKQKRVDIKAVKDAIWKIIKKECCIPENEHDISAGSKRRHNTPPLKLSHIIDILPSLLPEETSCDLSFAIVFMAVLHLANEKKLKLNGNPSLDDATIELDT